MGLSRVAWPLAVASLLLGACSGSDLMGPLGNPPPTGEGTDATIDAPGMDGSVPSPKEGGLMGTPTDSGTHDDSAAADSGLRDSASTDDGPLRLDAGAVDATNPTDSGAVDTGADGSSDATTDDAGTFACGPSKHCNTDTEYCRISSPVVVTNIVLPLDAGKSIVTYSCIALPVCDAADACACLKGTVGPLPQSDIVIAGSCSCDNQNGDITLTCTTGGVQPLN